MRVVGDGGRLKDRLSAKAKALGFDLCRIAAPDSIPLAPERLRAFIEAGCAGDMDWLAETQPRRADPRVLWPEVRAIVMLGMNYGPATDPLALLADRGAANISVYARHRDYHDVIKGKLKELAGWLVAAVADNPAVDKPEVKVFVDTAPVMEKPLAQAAGLGWQGKHTNLVSRGHGSWLFLGSVFTTLALEPDPPEVDHCGSCRACLDICPTAAFPAPYRLDARRCISYLTIEHQGTIDRALRPGIGNRIYGCDDCLAACPWNKFAVRGREAKLAARPALDGPPLATLASFDDATFRAFFAGGPVKRIGHARFLRNVLIAIGNSGDPALATAAIARLGHPSPIVRAMAVWATARLIGAAGLRAAGEGRERDETDPDVLAEWSAA
jgi:epoxyqueuosine reductase